MTLPPGVNDSEVLAVLRGSKVLFVDDEPYVLEAFAIMLKKLGCVVTPATTVADARAAIRNERFDVAILDIRLPDGTAVDIVPDLDSWIPAIPRIVVSGHDACDLVRFWALRHTPFYRKTEIHFSHFRLVLAGLVQTSREWLAGVGEVIRNGLPTDSDLKPILDTGGHPISEDELKQRYIAVVSHGEKHGPTAYNLTVLCMWARGLRDDEIAERVPTDVGHRAIEAHLKRLRELIGCATRREMAERLRIRYPATNGN